MEPVLRDRLTDALLANLTEPQAEAVRCTDGPLLVLAGAGAGKTRVITRRAAYLAATVTRPWNVLAITFTNKAANEMAERLVAMGVGREMTVCTFHALCARLLRIHHGRAGLPRDFTIFDVADQRKVLKEAIAAAGLSTDQWSPARVQGVISQAKNQMLTARAYEEGAADWSQRTVARIYAAYEEGLARQHGLDFDDLLLKLALLLRGDAELRGEIERRYTHVLIDEYQDTNAAQYEIARHITSKNANLCATGDPDQSIYGWRGADIRNILRFEEDFPQAHVVRLEQNYRSTKRILSAASHLIEHNVERKDKTLWTENPEGARVRVVSVEDAEDEAHFIAHEVARYRAEGGNLADVAVFYRLNSLSRTIEEALIRAGVPYQVARGTEFYNRKEIKDVLAYARVLTNPFDEVSLTRAINTPARGIGKTTIDRLVAHAQATGAPLHAVVAAPEQVAALQAAAKRRVAGFAQLLASLAPLVDGRPREGIEQLVSLTGIQAELAQLSAHDPEPAQNVEELISAASAFEEAHPDATLRDWLEYTSLLGDVDAVEEDTGKLTLMTLHAAKGLEFPRVYVIALEDGMLPFCRQEYDPTYDEEEERRLCFVGMTRAKQFLTLSHADYRMVRGVAERKTRSQFLDELPRGEIERVDGGTGSADKGRRAPRNRSALPADIERWQVHGLVRHPEYDLGRIVWIRLAGAQTRVHVAFQCGHEQTFLLAYADLTRVEFDEVD
ncbi:MAG TPA: UvrD-helicase domain-containing protein [Phycisphaerae bacterium]|nr:UvrD-helicase domain-containing protein [Phycisphaerales bacterium]HRX85169.1 UvrD-helicase domain-containing protein [Phycisphaerae bacterium]